MPRTRSVAQHEAADSKSNDNLPETGIETDADAATPASFNGRLSRFQYAGKDKASGDTASDLPETETTRSSPLKRPLSAVQSRTSNSPSPAKKRRATSKYAPPSRYAHLPPLVDILEPNLICVFVGCVTSEPHTALLVNRRKLMFSVVPTLASAQLPQAMRTHTLRTCSGSFCTAQAARTGG